MNSIFPKVRHNVDGEAVTIAATIFGEYAKPQNLNFGEELFQISADISYPNTTPYPKVEVKLSIARVTSPWMPYRIEGIVREAVTRLCSITVDSEDHGQPVVEALGEEIAKAIDALKGPRILGTPVVHKQSVVPEKSARPKKQRGRRRASYNDWGRAELEIRGITELTPETDTAVKEIYQGWLDRRVEEGEIDPEHTLSDPWDIFLKSMGLRNSE